MARINKHRAQCDARGAEWSGGAQEAVGQAELSWVEHLAGGSCLDFAFLVSKIVLAYGLCGHLASRNLAQVEP